MQAPELPRNEADRTQSLDQLGLIYSPAEARFDRITRLVRRHFNVDAALVSLVYKDMQWFKSVQGLNACSTARDVSFCGHVILQDDLFEVSDTHADSRFRDNPLVIGGPGIRFYAGVPLKDKQGLNLGTLCMFSSHARVLDSEERRDLIEFAALAQQELERASLSSVAANLVHQTAESKRAMMIDPILGTWNRFGFRELAIRECHEAILGEYGLGLLSVQVVNFEDLLLRYGNQRAVDISKYAAAVSREQLQADASAGSLGQDRLVLVVPRVLPQDVDAMLDRLSRTFATGALVSQGVEIQPQVMASGFYCSSSELKARSVPQFVDSLLT